MKKENTYDYYEGFDINEEGKYIDKDDFIYTPVKNRNDEMVSGNELNRIDHITQLYLDGRL